MAEETFLPDPTDSFGDSEVLCVSCGRQLGESSDDQPDWPTGPLCGDCYQARQMDDEIFWSEADSGEAEAGEDG